MYQKYTHNQNYHDVDDVYISYIGKQPRWSPSVPASVRRYLRGYLLVWHIAVLRNCCNSQFLAQKCATQTIFWASKALLLAKIAGCSTFCAQQCLAGANGARAVHGRYAPSAPAAEFEPPNVLVRYTTHCTYTPDLHKVHCRCSVYSDCTLRCTVQMHCTL